MIFTQEEAKGHCDCKELADALVDLVPKNNLFVDFGCGNGYYLSHLSTNDCIGTGIEGTQIKHSRIIHAELHKSLDYLFKGFSKITSLSFEVGEHIPKEFEQVFIDNITKFSNYLIMSWAIPGQGGLNHVNEQSNEYIISEIEKRKFVYNSEETTKFREKVKDSPEWWFKNTLMIFNRDGSINN